MAHDKQHLTTEEFSAYLDGELTSSEQDRLTQHLRSCPHCAQELRELRQTVSLLQALPQPVLPRAFTLAPDFSRLPDTPPLYAQDGMEDDKEIATPVPRLRSHWPSYARSSLRILSAVAAVIGLFLLGSGFLPLLSPHMETATSTSGKYAQSDNFNASKETPKAATQTPATQSPQVVTKSDQAQSVPASPSIRWPIIFIFDLNTGLGRLGLGLVILLLGIIGLLAFRLPMRA